MSAKRWVRTTVATFTVYGDTTDEDTALSPAGDLIEAGYEHGDEVVVMPASTADEMVAMLREFVADADTEMCTDWPPGSGKPCTSCRTRALLASLTDETRGRDR